jgi:hypothetical protein
LLVRIVVIMLAFVSALASAFLAHDEQALIPEADSADRALFV